MPWWMIVLLYVGYVGFSIAVATGSVLDGTREWLKSFKFRFNPLRFLGHLLGCSMCVGFWVGLAGDPLHGLYEGSWWIEISLRLASGGLVALSAYVINLALKGAEAAIAEKETEHEYIRIALDRAEHQPTPAEGPDMAPPGGPEQPGGEGDRGAGTG